jgi:hypothetical protein
VAPASLQLNELIKTEHDQRQVGPPAT